jgi:hypothetical protein
MLKIYGLIIALFALMLAGCGPNSSNSQSQADPPATLAESEQSAAEIPSSEAPALESELTETPPVMPSAVTSEPSHHESFNEYQILPVDESSQNESFAKFRKELLLKIDERDLDYLKQHIDPHVRYSFGADEGANGLMKKWNESYWTELKRMIELGGVFGEGDEKKLFVAPYVFKLFDELPEQFDPFSYGVAVEKEVKVYAERDAASEVLDVLDYTVVKMTYEEGDWTPVTTPAGYTGYVKKGQVRSPIDYRVFFFFDNGDWKIITFIAGD